MLTKQQAERIVKISAEVLATLPKAHYLKTSTISVSLDGKAPTSYFDPQGWRIAISMRNIAEALKDRDPDKMGWDDLEPTIRALTYHEISHALLTPKPLMAEAMRNGMDTELVNIIEDERIETLLAHYYKGVDFKANAKTLFDYRAPRSFKEWVFFGLRIRKAPFGLKEMLEKFGDFLQLTKNTNAVYFDVGTMLYRFSRLIEDLRKIFDKYAKPTPKQPQPNAKGERSGEAEDGDGETAEGQGTQGQGNDEDGEKRQNGKAEGANGEETEKDAEEGQEDAEGQKSAKPSKDGEDEDQPEEGNGEGEGQEESDPLDAEPEEAEAGEGQSLTTEEAEEIAKRWSVWAKSLGRRKGHVAVETIGDIQGDPEAKTGMLKAIIRNKGVGATQTPVIAGYNGKFSVKRYIKDQHLTMKWFDKALDGGDNVKRKGEKKILNIWLDQSGSFSGHDEQINAILASLYQIEKSRSDFEFRLIRMTTEFVIERNPDLRVSSSDGDNALPKDQIEACYRETNKTQRELNIVLFDGLTAYTEEKIEERMQWGYSAQHFANMHYSALSVLNNKRTIFITEMSNTEGIRKACPNCREIIEENDDYEGKLKANIIRAFDLLF